MSCIYGWPQTHEKRHTWGLIEILGEEQYDNWLCVGDFNQVLHANDKTGGREVDFGLMSDFQSALDRCGLVELPYEGNKFTWDNGRTGSGFIQERLDLGFANDGMLKLYPDICAHHLLKERSDHVPVCFQFQR